MPPDAQRILIIRPSALGDIARSVPVLASLRSAYPDARIDWLVRDTFAPVLAHHPALSNLVLFPRGEFGRWIRHGNLTAIRRYLRTLREPGYDLVFDLQGLARSGLFAWATRAPVRVGYADARELGWLGVNHRVRTPKVVHTVDKALMLLEHVGIPAQRDADAQRLFSSADDRAWLETLEWSRSSYCVLAPTSAWPAKQWPAERFGALAERVAGLGVRPIVVGAAHERAQCEEVTRRACARGGVDLVGKTSIGQLMSVIERAALVVANDSASLHIAVGFNRPIIALLGPTDPKLACPYGRAHDVIQHIEPGDEFYFRDDRSAGMMRRITSEEVIARVEGIVRSINAGCAPPPR